MKKEPLRLGLVMAGAVTAGAFTAGVIDYLINTLQLWHNEYQKRPDEVPEPNVIIDVMTGASAGGITAAVTTLGLTINKLNPVSTTTSKADAKENILFDTWVNFGKPENESIIDDLFSLDDLEEKTIHSLLNTNFITRLMDKLIVTVGENPKVDLPGFINPELNVLMTLSNLRGIPLDLYFTENKSKVAHTMRYHKAYAHFEINDTVAPNKLPLDLNKDDDLKLFLDVARASGAFPIGLKSVAFKGIPKSYIEENIKHLFGNSENLKPFVEDEYSFLATDGGMTNNEPLAEALKILKQKGDNYKLILIDPFPGRIGEPKKDTYDIEKNSIYQVIPQLYSTLRNQVLFKENDILDLFQTETNKNMIWPTRYGKNKESLNNAIASGALSGFAGFINRDFRYHDYMLGQKNAQNFIRFYFNTDKDLDKWRQEDLDFFGLIDKHSDSFVMPIIPDYSIKERGKSDYGVEFLPALHSDPNFPEFPSVSYKPVITSMEKKMKKRIKKVVKLSFDRWKQVEEKPKTTHPIVKKREQQFFLFKIGGWIGKKAGSGFMSLAGVSLLTKSISKRVTNSVITSLADYDLLKDDK